MQNLNNKKSVKKYMLNDVLLTLFSTYYSREKKFVSCYLDDIFFLM